jgi:DNA topoisomerase-1
LLKKIKYVYPAAVSKIHAEGEKGKFEDAMNLGDYIEKIRKFYSQSLRKNEYVELACILYLIDNLGIRIGNENNTRVEGASTLKRENIVIWSGTNRVRVRFKGKDSIDYDNQIICSKDFIRSIQMLSDGKNPTDQLFPNVTPKIVNEYLQSFHPSLSAKTFRTYNATMKMKEYLEAYRPGVDNPGDFFRKGVTEVAVFCNHKKISTLRKSR